MSINNLIITWNYTTTKNTPDNDKREDAIYLENTRYDEHSSIEFGVNDIDNIIEKLQDMKEEWAKRDWIYKLPERFAFTVEIDKTNKIYYATRDKSDENKVVVMWQITDTDFFDSYTYSKQDVLDNINLKKWINVSEY